MDGVKHSSGVALVMVLACVALVTPVVLFLLCRIETERGLSSCGSHQIRADILGRSALDLIVADLKEELAIRSKLRSAGGVMIHEPQTPEEMLPLRTGNPPLNTQLQDPIPNLVRTSCYNDGELPVRSRASAVNSTADPSLNRRSIGLARWNHHYLIPRQETGPRIDCTPVSPLNDPPDLDGFMPPDWVFVTSNGRKVLNGPAGDVLGRYAFAIYDEGGLLDANVAGFPGGSSPVEIGLKGGAVWADLAGLPTASSSTLPQSQVNNLLGWRHGATAQPAGTLRDNYDFTPEAVARFWTLVPTRARDGFLLVPKDLWGGRSDQVFTSRQALLKFRRACGFSQNALQYLGTFSRDLEQPAHVPDPKRPRNRSQPKEMGGNDAFDPTGVLQDRINPAVLPLRKTSGGPVVDRRFPLSRIRLLDPAHPDRNAEEIERCFGLRWAARQICWSYQRGDRILLLEEVPDGRFPDFLEILKAAIHVDSLGKQYGSSFDSVDSPHRIGAAGLDGVVDFQIVQIAANIIDQFDSDHFPTRIRFAGREFYGIENLPYLNKTVQLFYRQRLLGPGEIAPGMLPASGGLPFLGVAMIQPELWNPHVPDPQKRAGPVRFQVVAGGVGTAHTELGVKTGPRVWWNQKEGFQNLYPLSASAAATFRAGQRIEPDTAWIRFRMPVGEFREPARLKSPDYPPGSQAQGYATEPTLDSLELNDPEMPETHSNQAIGFRAGYCWMGPGESLTQGFIESSSGLELQLQHENPYGESPDYLTYDVMESVPLGARSVIFDPVPDRRSFVATTRFDPRTDRFGQLGTVSFRPWPTSETGDYWPEGETLRPATTFAWSLQGQPAAPGWFSSEASGQGYTPGFLVENMALSRARNLYHADPDGIIRRGVGAFASGVNGIPTLSGNLGSRPVILNRPFRSVAELGYVFRGVAWKEIDFSSPESGDSALLDFFCIEELESAPSTPLIAGRVNLNTRQAPVLKALLKGASKAEGGYLGNAEAESVARALVEWTRPGQASGRGPLRDRGELVGRFVSGTTYSGFVTQLKVGQGFKTAADSAIKRRRESVVRALADAGTTRVWNLMIDVVAQSGRFAPAATRLGDFVVQAERRFWLHVSIDRFTGEVLDSQLELVLE